MASSNSKCVILCQLLDLVSWIETQSLSVPYGGSVAEWFGGAGVIIQRPGFKASTLPPAEACIAKCMTTVK